MDLKELHDKQVEYLYSKDHDGDVVLSSLLALDDEWMTSVPSSHPTALANVIKMSVAFLTRTPASQIAFIMFGNIERLDDPGPYSRHLVSGAAVIVAELNDDGTDFHMLESVHTWGPDGWEKLFDVEDNSLRATMKSALDDMDDLFVGPPSTTLVTMLSVLFMEKPSFEALVITHAAAKWLVEQVREENGEKMLLLGRSKELYESLLGLAKKGR